MISAGKMSSGKYKEGTLTQLSYLIEKLYTIDKELGGNAKDSMGSAHFYAWLSFFCQSFSLWAIGSLLLPHSLRGDERRSVALWQLRHKCRPFLTSLNLKSEKEAKKKGTEFDRSKEIILKLIFQVNKKQNQRDDLMVKNGK